MTGLGGREREQYVIQICVLYNCSSEVAQGNTVAQCVLVDTRYVCRHSVYLWHFYSQVP